MRLKCVSGTQIHSCKGGVGDNILIITKSIVDAMDGSALLTIHLIGIQTVLLVTQDLELQEMSSLDE